MIIMTVNNHIFLEQKASLKINYDVLVALKLRVRFANADEPLSTVLLSPPRIPERHKSASLTCQGKPVVFQLHFWYYEGFSKGAKTKEDVEVEVGEKEAQYGSKPRFRSTKLTQTD